MKGVNDKPTHLSISMYILHIKISIWQVFPLQLLTQVQKLIKLSTNEAKVHPQTTQTQKRFSEIGGRE